MEFRYINAKPVGNFVVHYPDNDTVAISYKGLLGNLSTQLLTHEKVKGFLTPTGAILNIAHRGFFYPGIVFAKPSTMTDTDLEDFLKTVE